MASEAKKEVLIDAMVCSVFVFALTAVMVLLGAWLHGGELSYAVDDAYIHLAMARNWRLHGVWAPSGTLFASATSSPLWTWLLSASFVVWGPWVGSNAFFCALFTVPLLMIGSVVLHEVEPTVWKRRALLCAAACAASLPAMLASGMEHVAQMGVFVPFVWAVAQSKETHGRRLLLLLAPFLLLLRFEALFIGVAATLVLLLRRQLREAVFMVCLAVIPVLFFAWWSVRNGGMPLPNPIVVKGQLVRIDGLASIVTLLIGRGITPFIEHFQVTGAMLVAAVSVGLRLRQAPSFLQPSVVFALLFCWATIAQMLWAQLGAFWRYEAWFVYGLALSIAWLHGELKSAISERASVWLRIFAALFLGSRLLFSLGSIPIAVHGVWLQQWQLARFVRARIGQGTVVLNDIGVVAWSTEAPIIDLVGLASTEIARARRNRTHGPALYERVCRGARIAAVYDEWFATTGLPRSWTRIGQWQFSMQGSAGVNRLTFYAIEPSTANELRETLQHYALPQGVRLLPP